VYIKRSAWRFLANSVLLYFLTFGEGDYYWKAFNVLLYGFETESFAPELFIFVTAEALKAFKLSMLLVRYK
jgi:hypothetical protein